MIFCLVPSGAMAAKPAFIALRPWSGTASLVNSFMRENTPSFCASDQTLIFFLDMQWVSILTHRPRVSFSSFFEHLRKRRPIEREVSSLALALDENNLIVDQNTCLNQERPLLVVSEISSGEQSPRLFGGLTADIRVKSPMSCHCSTASRQHYHLTWHYTFRHFCAIS